MEKIGFIGLGNMGRGMSTNLVKHGYSVVVYDINPEAVKVLAEVGAKAANSPREVAEQSEIIILSLPYPADVEQVITGPDGILGSAQKGSTIIDTSTIDPLTSQKLAETASSKGVDMLDAPVAGGGPSGATVGKQMVIVGGKKEVFDRRKGVLNVIGNNIVYAGSNGKGLAIKLCFNMYGAMSVAAAAETFAFGVKCGVDPKVIFNVINTAKGGDWILEKVCPWPDVVPGTPASRNYEMPGFMTDLMVKDMGLVVGTAKEKNMPLLLTNLVHQMYGATGNLGLWKKDYTSIMTLIRRLAGLEIESDSN